MIYRFVLLTLILLPTASFSQGTVLGKRISIGSERGQELPDLCRALDISCAIEIDTDKIDESKNLGNSVKLTGTGQNILRRTMRYYPGHRWLFDEKKRFLTVLPTVPVKNNPLDVLLGDFEFRDKDFDEIRREIAKKDKTLVWGQLDPSPPQEATRGISFSVKSATARQVLDAAIISHGHSSWVVRDVYGMTNVVGSTLEFVDYDR